MTIFGGILLYLSLAGAAAGVVSLLLPLRFLGIRTRKKGLLVLGVSFLVFITGVCLPVTEMRVCTPRTRLDEFAPVFQFNELHSVPVNASKERIDWAIRTVRPEEIRFYKTLVTIRGLQSLASEGRPILSAFTSGWFTLLADEPGHEIVVGRRGPQIGIAMNFRIEERDSTHCLLTTETRVDASPGNARRGFATYWRMIYPGSSLIRSMWLRAIKLRAESPLTSVTVSR
jgi:hypothetical protein